MSLPVYSKTLASVVTSSGAGVVALFTVPAGRTYVIRDIRLTIESSGAASSLFLSGPGPYLASFLAASSYDVFSLVGHVVLETGAGLNLYAPTGVVTCLVSGYDLSNV